MSHTAEFVFRSDLATRRISLTVFRVVGSLERTSREVDNDVDKRRKKTNFRSVHRETRALLMLGPGRLPGDPPTSTFRGRALF